MKNKTTEKLLFLTILLFGVFLDISFSVNITLGYVIKTFTLALLLPSFFYFFIKVFIWRDESLLKAMALFYIYVVFVLARDLSYFPIFGIIILINLGSCFFVYYLSRKNLLGYNELRSIFKRYAYFSLIGFLLSYNFVEIEVDENLYVGPSYIIMPIFSFLMYFYWTQPKRLIVYYLIILIITAVAGKRTVFLTGIFGLLIYFYYYREFHGKKILKKVVTAIVVFSFIILSSFYLYNNNELFRYRVDQSIDSDDGARTIIYENIIVSFLRFDDTERVFGMGFNGVKNLVISRAGNSIHAHNDFLELLIDTGVVGLFFYLLILFYFLIFILSNTHNLRDKSVLVFLFISWIILSSTQANIYTNTSIMYFILLGFIMGKRKRIDLSN